MSEFTPGTWMVTHGAGGYDTVVSTEMDHKGAHAVAYTVQRPPRIMQEVEANAHLISTSPDGLALAKAIVAHCDYPPMQKDWQRMVDAARALIQKAEAK